MSRRTNGDVAGRTSGDVAGQTIGDGTRRAPGILCLGALAVLLSVLGVDGIKQLLQFGSILIADGRLGVIVIIVVKEHGEHVGDGLSVRVAIGVHGGVGALGKQLMFQTVALAVSPDDAAHLPEAEVVEKFTARDSDFAHEQLVDVVGGG